MPQYSQQDSHMNQYTRKPAQLSPITDDFDSDPEAWSAGAETQPHYTPWFLEPGASSQNANTHQGNNAQSRQSSVETQNSATNSKTALHAWVQRSQVTPSKSLNHLVMEFTNGGVKSYFCGWEGCKHPVGFAQKPQLITHIRSAHLHEKPFLCTTCNTLFARKQEASRHVVSLNSGRRYKCSGCHQAFSRKNYRDAHEEGCMFGESGSTTTRTERPPDRSDLLARP